MNTGEKRRATGSNRFGMAVVVVVVVILMTTLLVRSAGLKKRIVMFQASNAALKQQIQEEKDRSEELKILPDYVSSDEYIEKAAREKFGLVYADEIIFRPAE